MALILAFVFISAPVAISGGGTTDKHPWDEDSVGDNGSSGGGNTDYVGTAPAGDDDPDDPDEGACGTGVTWFIRNISVRNIVQIVTLYRGVTGEANRGVTNTGSENASVR